MSEKEQAPATDQRNFSIQRIYTRDISFETPNSPGIFRQQWKPETALDINTNVKDLEEGSFEVTLTVTVTTKVEEKTAYLAEVQQSGIFTISGFPEKEKGPLIGAYCPNVLFPYAREVISDLVTKGSFPQLMLQPVNFDALYAQHQQELAKQGDKQPTTH
ncbi:MAG: protein-export chaperone SecB [Candidatus Polarisedimenticolaceae bacterium]|nr:protein-export chaperone SecB [Candidatus Polarisedimenticolaceae bacterium]